MSMGKIWLVATVATVLATLAPLGVTTAPVHAASCVSPAVAVPDAAANAPRAAATEWPICPAAMAMLAAECEPYKRVDGTVGVKFCIAWFGEVYEVTTWIPSDRITRPVVEVKPPVIRQR
jgi:hypothetical protein